MSTVTFEGVSRLYAGAPRAAVHALDLQIEAGELLVLVGPTGCGKSTTLRMLAGVEEVSQGRIFLNDRDITTAPPGERDVAIVNQNYALYPHMTVAENMGFTLKMQGLDKPTRTERVREAAALLGLEDYLDRKPKSLSGGQRQRVAMGRAIVVSPQVYLMDEPLSNLDANLRANTRRQISILQERMGVTALYVTHDQIEAMTLGHRVAVMNEGVLQQVADPWTLYTRPVNTFVASFIGSPTMTLMTASRTDGGYDVGGYVVPATPEVDLAEAIVGVRPEDFRLADDGLALEVLSTDFVGADSFIRGRRPGDDVDVTVRVPGARAPKNGSTVYVTIDADAVHYFHPQTKLRVN